MNKVKIVAIAKDEAAYFSEWVHHHLFVGVDAIDVYVNRTTDNSVEVLDKISKAYPQVSVKNADWIDMCSASVRSAMQYITYAKAFTEEKERGEFTHLLFIDIDEFWISKDFNKKISDCINELGRDNPIAFEWLNESPTIAPFQTLPQTLSGVQSVLVKALVPLSAEIKRIDIHLPTFNKATPDILLADGSIVSRKEGMKQAVQTDIEQIKDYFILHRSIRSHFEYVSLLLKGNPEDDYPFKQNRKGIKIFEQEMTQNIAINHEAYDVYQQSYAIFLSECLFEYEIDKARDFVIKRYSDSIIALKNNIDDDYNILRVIFLGVELDEVRNIFKAYRTSVLASKQYTLQQLKLFYSETVFYDQDEAFIYISLAKKMHPTGPWINDEYNKLNNKRNSK